MLFFGESFPIYYGAPNLSDWLGNSYKPIDINNIDESIKTRKSYR